MKLERPDARIERVEHVEHKKVEMVELFFDLVLVYAISQTTGLIHHLHGGVVDPLSLASFAISYVIIVNAWMYQVIFTNRFGSNSPRDIAFSLVTMALLLFLSNTIASDWESTFLPFSVALGVIFLVQMTQYAIAYAGERGEDARFLIRGFLLLTGIYAGALFAGSLLPYEIGVFVTMGGLVANVLLPLRFRHRLDRIPVNFPHLVERLGLLVIITFGEMIVGIAPWFTAEAFSLESVLVFAICAAMFVHYLWMFDRMIDLNVAGIGSAKLQYAHLPVFLGLGMMTVSLAFLQEPEEANALFVALFMYAGLALFYLGLFGSRGYLQERYRPTRPMMLAQLAVFLAALGLSCLLRDWPLAVIAATLLCTAAECATMAAMYWSGKWEGTAPSGQGRCPSAPPGVGKKRGKANDGKER